MVENAPQDEPKPVGEILNDEFTEVIGFKGDPAREVSTQKTDLNDESKSLQDRIDDLWEEIQSGRADEGAMDRLEALKRDSVEVDGDRFELQRKQDDNPPQ